MTNEKIEELKRHFLEWSGGFEPESFHQITVYIDYAIDVDVNPEEARQVLTEWISYPSPD
jgi:hypothetical protein